MQNNKMILCIVIIRNECCSYLPSPQAQNWHACTIIQLYGPGHLSVLHGVQQNSFRIKQKKNLSTNLLHSQSDFLFRLCPQAAILLSQCPLYLMSLSLFHMLLSFSLFLRASFALTISFSSYPQSYQSSS